jgi:hypothetical protein
VQGSALRFPPNRGGIATVLGHAGAVRQACADTLAVAYATNPERFVRNHPQPPDLPGTAWINQPEPVH